MCVCVRLLSTAFVYWEPHCLCAFLLFHALYFSCSSVFALATAEELDETLRSWREKINNGTADQYIEKCEEVRKTLGITTSVVAYKQ